MTSPAFSLSRRACLFGLPALLAACNPELGVSYPDPTSGFADDWHVVGVTVVTPQTLKVSEVDSLSPRADVVWYGDPPGDRRAQVAAVVKSGIELGVKPLTGKRDVIFSAEVLRFHILTPHAYFVLPKGQGVYSMSFNLSVRDAKTGEVLQPMQRIEADMGAKVMRQETGLDPLTFGDREKVEIIDQIGRVVASWLGQGPDAREGLYRFGR